MEGKIFSAPSWQLPCNKRAWENQHNITCEARFIAFNLKTSVVEHRVQLWLTAYRKQGNQHVSDTGELRHKTSAGAM